MCTFTKTWLHQRWIGNFWNVFKTLSKIEFFGKYTKSKVNLWFCETFHNSNSVAIPILRDFTNLSVSDFPNNCSRQKCSTVWITWFLFSNDENHNGDPTPIFNTIELYITIEVALLISDIVDNWINTFKGSSFLLVSMNFNVSWYM